MDKYDDLGLEASKFIEDLNMYEASKDGLFRVDKAVGNNPEFEETRKVFATKMAKIHLQKQREQEELLKATSGAPNGGVGLGPQHLLPGPPVNRTIAGTNNLRSGETIAKPPLAGSSALVCAGHQLAFPNQAQAHTDGARTELYQDGKRASGEYGYSENLERSEVSGGHNDHRADQMSPGGTKVSFSSLSHEDPNNSNTRTGIPGWGRDSGTFSSLKSGTAASHLRSNVNQDSLCRSPTKPKADLLLYQQLHSSCKTPESGYGSQESGNEGPGLSQISDPNPACQGPPSFSHASMPISFSAGLAAAGFPQQSSSSSSSSSAHPTQVFLNRSDNFHPSCGSEMPTSGIPNKSSGNNHFGHSNNSQSSVSGSHPIPLPPSAGYQQTDTHPKHMGHFVVHGQNQRLNCIGSGVSPEQNSISITSHGPMVSNAPKSPFKEAIATLQHESGHQETNTSKIKLPCQTLLQLQEQGPSTAELKLEALTQRLEQEMDACPKTDYFGKYVFFYFTMCFSLLINNCG